MGDGAGIVVRPSGDLDLATVEAFRALVDDALEASPTALVIDLTDVDFLDSSGIAVLAFAMKAQRAHGGAIALIHPRPIVERAVSLVGLSMLFDTADVPAHLLVTDR